MFGIIQAAIATGAALALLTFACITLGGSAVAFIISTPLFIIFSPVLVPATIATTLLATGFTATGSFASTALSIIMWIFKKYTGKEPPKKGVYAKKEDEKDGKKDKKKDGKKDKKKDGRKDKKKDGKKDGKKGKKDF